MTMMAQTPVCFLALTLLFPLTDKKHPYLRRKSLSDMTDVIPVYSHVVTLTVHPDTQGPIHYQRLQAMWRASPDNYVSLLTLPLHFS